LSRRQRCVPLWRIVNSESPHGSSLRALRAADCLVELRSGCWGSNGLATITHQK
jgi:hypothetical protein